MSSKTHSVQFVGSHGVVIDIECHVTNGLPNVVVVGMTNKSVDESRERLRAAFSSSKLPFPKKRVTINLAPADIQKLGSSFDVAIAASLLQAVDAIAIPAGTAFFGELGLDGKVRPVHGLIGKILAARDQGLSTMVIPADNLKQAQLVPHVQLLAVSSLKELYLHFCGLGPLTAYDTRQGRYAAPTGLNISETDIAEVVGQERAKRALLIAAAGGHNLLLSGAPGMGKSMLAKTLPGILPSLSHEEALQITHLHSLGNHELLDVVYERPFRAPHHSASNTSIVGGGQMVRPGEITLASGGVLFLDELPEFNRSTIESLRQPLEDGVVSIARARETIQFPASFMLVATRNPCPCGYYGSKHQCTCSAAQIAQYNKKISGPIEDRIDIHVTVDTVDHKNLLKTPTTANSAKLRKIVERVRTQQSERYKLAGALNAKVPTATIKKFASLEPAAETLLNMAAAKLELSPRVYMKTIKIARTIADIDQSAAITSAHISEALQYRPIKTSL